MGKHLANKRQQKAFEKVVKAMENAKKLGLVFYAKQWTLVAYTKDADNYAEQNCPLHKLSYVENCGVIPYLDAYGLLSDSGADDYAVYISDKDAKKYNPDNL